MKITNVLPKLGVLLLVIVAFASCEEDFSNLDTNIINENFTFFNKGKIPLNLFGK